MCLHYGYLLLNSSAHKLSVEYRTSLEHACHLEAGQSGAEKKKEQNAETKVKKKREMKDSKSSTINTFRNEISQVWQ